MTLEAVLHLLKKLHLVELNVLDKIREDAEEYLKQKNLTINTRLVTSRTAEL